MKEIPLTKGKVAQVDDEDFEWLNQRKWHYNGRYASSVINGKTAYMHRLILGLTARHQITDHIDNDGVNNQRTNLRECTQGQNLCNRQPWLKKTYKGVWKNNGRWTSEVMLGGERKYLGCFDTQEQALVAHDRAAKDFHGEFAKTNGFENLPLVPNAVKTYSSKYRGVAWHKAGKKWAAHVKSKGHVTYLGLFTDEVEAAKAYDIKAKELHGDKAKLNF
jgi:hypothetical protein